MEVNGVNRCISCMEPLDNEGNCTYCEMNQKTYAPIPRCLLPGTKLADRYVLGKVLGEGSFGITYIGWDVVLDLPVAIKEYYPSDLVSRDVIRGTDRNVYVYETEGKEEYQENLDKFLNEARCLTRFNRHGGIVSVRDFFCENNTAYIVMEYVGDKNVKEYVRNYGAMEAKDVLCFMRPILDALVHVHASGMVHRDISPDNLLFDKEGNLVLIDFGSARVRNVEMTRSMTVVFKRGFSPEEQYRSKGKQGAWSDIYAICATIYYMLTGITPEEAIERVLGAPMKSLLDMPEIDLSEKQKSAIMKGISVKAEERYQNVEQLISVLYEKTEESVPREKKETPPTNKLKKEIIIAMAVIFVVLVIGFGVLIKTMARESKQVSTPKVTASQTTPTVSATVTPSPKPTPKVYTMMSCKGMTKKQARNKLEKLAGANIKITWKEKYSDTVKKGIIIRQSIKKGKQWKEGEKLSLILYVSKGKKPVVPTATPKPTPAPTEKTDKNQDKEKIKDQFAGFI